MHEEFKETFKRLALSFSEVERAIECPKNYLSRFINGPATLPSKWEVKIQQFLALTELIDLPKTKIMTKEETAEWYRKDVERMKEKYSPENMELLKNTQLTTPTFDIEIINARMKELEWVGKTEEWCRVKGFPPSELIEQFEELEKLNRYNNGNAVVFGPQPENKPNTAHKTEKGKEGAENAGEPKPKELSPFLKSRQNLKNGIK